LDGDEPVPFDRRVAPDRAFAFGALLVYPAQGPALSGPAFAKLVCKSAAGGCEDGADVVG
jgi:hypothetical protein